MKISLTDQQQDYLTELFNIGVGKASAVLSSMIEKYISLSIPQISLIYRDQLSDELQYVNDEANSLVLLGIKGKLDGSMFLVFSDDTAKKITNELETEESKENTITEIGNIVLNCIVGTLGNILSEKIDYTPPKYYNDCILNVIEKKSYKENDQSVVLLANTKLVIRSLSVNTTILITLDLNSYTDLIHLVDKLVEAHNDD